MNEVKIPHIDKLCNDVPTKQFFAFLDEPMIISQKLLVHHITGEDTVTHFNNVQKNKKECDFFRTLNGLLGQTMLYSQFG